MKPKHFWNVKKTGLGLNVKEHFYSYWTYSRNEKYRLLLDENNKNKETNK